MTSMNGTPPSAGRYSRLAAPPQHARPTVAAALTATVGPDLERAPGIASLDTGLQ